MMRIPFSPVFLPLSPVWKRPSNALSTMKLVFASPDLMPHHIRQNIVSDCSVCSSIAVCLNHHKTFNSKVKHSHSSDPAGDLSNLQLGLSCLSPDVPGSNPASENDLYSLKLHVNGGLRKVSNAIQASILLSL